MDIYSRKILGCQVFENMLSENNVSVLKSTLKSRGIEDYDEELIHHSDKGSQYLSTKYMQLLLHAGIKLSLAENSLQNGYAERINGTIKNNYLVSYATENLTMLRKHLRYCVDLYNNERPHSSLKYLTPTAFERSLKNKAGEPMKLYDFNQKVSYEFLEASDIQSGTKETGSTCQAKSNTLNFNK
jgi:transposase InsO family protein